MYHLESLIFYRKNITESGDKEKGKLVCFQ